MKCALITGGSRGIGRAICIKMAEDGYYVLVNYKTNTTEANKTLEAIRQHNGQGELLQFDVADKDAVKEVLSNWLQANAEKNIEVLVNNAGIKDDVLMSWMDDDQWDRVIKTNLYSFFYVTRLILPGMILRKYGRIINIVSLSALKGLPGQTNYSAAKAGVIGATKALAQEVARQGITVNSIAPGFIKTDMLDGIDEKDILKLVPARRIGLPEEIAFAAAFLADPQAGYITAQVLSINGGLYS
ncbi:MAG: 3-oxoacyl-ACP reductase FabG [Ferruginibacter sp.]